MSGVRGWRRALGVGVTGVVLVLSGVATGAVAEAAVVVGPVANVAGGCLENTGGSTAENNRFRLAACRTGPAQQVTRWSDATLRVQGKCVDLLAGRTAVETPVALTTCGTSTSQRWGVLGDGRVVNHRALLCLQPARARVVAGAPITVGTCSTAPAQRWRVPAVSTPPAPTPPPPTTPPPPPAPTTTTVPPPAPTTIPPVTPPTTVTPAPLPVGTASWSSDFTGSGLGRFQSTPWNNVGAPAPTLVASPVSPGARSLQVTMPGGGTRAEVVPATRSFVEGDDLWFGYSVRLAPDFPTDVVSWQLITQWKNDGTGSPPVEVTVGKGNVWLSGGYGHPAGPRSFAVPISVARPGTTIDLAFHIRFSRDPARASVDVWRDGVPAVVGYRPPGGTLYPTSAASTASLSSYWKMGLYRDSAITAPARMTIESATVGSGGVAVGGR